MMKEIFLLYLLEVGNEMSKISKTKVALMDALTYLMAEKPLQNIKIKEICEHANCNRGTFYSHYAQKEQLLSELLDIRVAHLQTVLEKVDEELSKKTLNEALQPLFQYIFDNRYFLSTMLGDYKVRGFRQALFAAYKATVAPKLMKEISILREDPLLQELQLNCISSSWLGVALYWSDEQQMSVEYVTAEYIKILQLSSHPILTDSWRFKKRKKVDTKKGKAYEIFQITLLKLLEDTEYKQIRIQDIIDHSGYNRTTFYQNFQDKDALYHTMRDQFLENMFYSITNGYEQNALFVKPLSPLSSCLHYLYDNRHFLTMMYGPQVVPGFFKHMFAEITDFFHEELSEQKIDVDINLYSNYLMNMLMAVVGSWFTEGLRYAPAFMTELLTEFLDSTHYQKMKVGMY